MQRRYGVRPDIFNNEVLIVDQQFDSEYFRVSEMPLELTAGKNMFKVFGNSSKLMLGSQIPLLITDSNNNPIYHQVENYSDESGRALISVWIYPETPPGLAKIEIRGVATVRPSGKLVPKNFENTFNVKWSREIIVDPTKDNTTPIIFKTVPGVSIQETIREYLNQSYETGTAFTSSNGLSGANLTYSLGTDNQGYINSDTSVFSYEMEGGSLNIPDTTFDLGSYDLQDDETIDYSGYINQVVNDTLIKVTPYSLDVSTTNTVSGGGRDGTETSISVVNSTISPSTFGPISDFTMSWQQEPTYINGGLNSQSYASITLKNLKPMTGRIDSIRTFIKSHGVGDFILARDSKLRDQNLLIDNTSTQAYYSIGNFRNQDVINTYWSSGSVNESIAFENKYDNSQIISSMVITGSEDITATNAFISVSNKTGINIYKDNEYKIGMKVVCKKTDNQTINSKMDIYISGSSIGNSDDRGIGTKLITLEASEDLVTDVNVFEGVSELLQSGVIALPPVATSGQVTEVPGQFSENEEQEISIISSFISDTRRLELLFEPSKDTSAHIVFAVTAGKWFLSDVFLQGARDLGFTPNHTFLEIPIDSLQADDVLDFKFEFVNPNGSPSNLALTTQSMDFVGSNTFISGPNNQLSGSVAIGGGILMEGF